MFFEVEKMGTMIIILILLVIVVLALGSIKKRIKYGSSCCGTHEPAPKKIRVRDKNKAHYPYTALLAVDGMHCSNCACRVENALNVEDGIWAKVNLEAKSVLVRSKNPLQEAELSRIISQAGYTLLKME